ncbi:MAG: hypothetical protein D9V46_14005 [Deltaproteobacteria bacterium]|uniref:hypothetical protein n=1 Tax=Hydrosulfovibrio ferrireducens TaxID=2934181 RepID=UPI00120A40A4|nr:MAG: hypothetical protein D9V46_14005 [Deltaproteobacteria bacterium]
MSPTEIPNIYFIFPYRGVGGVSLLFLRLAEFFAENGMARSYLVDYPDGFMASHRRDGLARLLPYTDDAAVDIPAGAVAIFQSMTPWSIYPSLRLAKETRVLFWNCHPFNLVPTLPGVRQVMQSHLWFGRLMLDTLLIGYKLKIFRLINLLIKQRSLVFMDSTNHQTTEGYLGLKIAAPVYLPIPASPPEVPVESAVVNGRDFRVSGIRVGWVGRVVDFKYHVLKRALIELNLLQPSCGVSISVTIVGTGEFADRLKLDAKRLENISIDFVEHISPGELDRYLLEHFDLLLAMGTCALDGAKLGIPTILLDCSYKKVPTSYLFQWLHERKGYTLGDLIGSVHLNGGTDSMAARVQELLLTHSSLSAAARSYVDTNHDLAKIANRLLNIVGESRCLWQEIEGARILGRGFVYSVFDRTRKKLVAK